jgi:hypothetical protein
MVGYPYLIALIARRRVKSYRFKRPQLYRMYRKSQLKLKNEVAVICLEVSWIQ